MEDVRCECGKIICQLQNNQIFIKCRHCKRFVIIRVEGSISLESHKGAPENNKIREVISL